MNNQNRRSLLIFLIVQTIITIIYSFCLISMVLTAIRVSTAAEFVAILVKYLPEFVILIASLCPQFALLLKHKLHSQDGEILPLLFTVTSLQFAFIIVDATKALGYIFVYPAVLLVVERFSLLGGASLLLISALRYYGYSSSSMSLYTIGFLSASMILSCLVPMSSYNGIMDITTSVYEIYIQIAVIAIYLSVIVTFLVTAVKDKTSLNVKRSIAFIMISIGLYLAHMNNLYTSVLSIILYIPGSIILVRNAGDSL